MLRRIIILGSTGSIGTQSLEVIAHLNDLHKRKVSPIRFEVVALAAGTNAALLLRQAERFGVHHVGLADTRPITGTSLHVRLGPDAAEQLVREVDCDMVIAAMVGSAGIPATLASVVLGRTVALANKETLVAAGELVIPAAHRSGAKILPIDSEHAGLWQCLAGADTPAPPPFDTPASLVRAVITASGGPFREWKKADIDAATPAQALRHPTWTMGRKVTIDSASLMNKALEVIEARWLFNLSPDRISVLVHPQSIVHAMAEFTDGNVVAQLAAPDMKAPIQHALTWPARTDASSQRLDLASLGSLSFESPDLARFPALGLGYEALARGGTAGAILNAANEAAVLAFLKGPDHGRHIPFGAITKVVAETLTEVPATPLLCIEDCLRAEAAARAYVERRLPR